MKICLKNLLVLLFGLLSLGHSAIAQVVDRYPVIQCPTETSALIAWRSAATSQSFMRWGQSASAMTNVVSDPAATQKHAHRLDGLDPNTEYFYQTVNPGMDSSSIESFFTAKTMQEQTVSFLHYGDCGYDNSVQNDIAALMTQEEVDFAVVAGDVDQGDGSDYDDIFFGVYKDMLANECHYTAIGNHDIIADNGATYLDAFYLPTNNPQQSEHYYTFAWGHTKFICLDSNIPYNPGSDQHNFLLEELKCNEHEWLFVFFHHPPWTNAWDPTYYVPFQQYYEYDGNDDMRTDLVPLFEQYKVDFVLNGHSHCYQRGDLNGVHYVISGGAGSSLIDARTCNTFPGFNACAPNISVEAYVNQYVRFDVQGHTAKYYAIDITGSVFDSVVVTKPSWTTYNVGAQATDPTTPSGNDGTISTNVVGPYPPYTFSWNTGATTGSVSGLSAGVYQLTITNGKGCEHIEEYMLNGLVGLPDAQNAALRIYPVPFSDFIVFEGWPNDPAGVQLEIMDIQGRTVVKQAGFDREVRLSTTNLADGLYLYRVISRDQIYSGKVLKR